MKTKNVLQDARKLLEQGWTKGVCARDIDGKPVNTRDAEACSWCPEGAIYAIEQNWHIVDEALSLLLLLVNRFSNREYDDVDEFNDHPGTTKEDVLELFDQAITRCDNGN